MAHVSAALHSLIIDGVFAGVGSVLFFCRSSPCSSFFLSILEDSGYMPRVAFVMDRLLRPLGLSGRSIVPMLIGWLFVFPPSWRPEPPKPARSPHDDDPDSLYVVQCKAADLCDVHFGVFPGSRGACSIGLYMTGIAASILCAFLLKETLFSGKPVPVRVGSAELQDSRREKRLASHVGKRQGLY